MHNPHFPENPAVSWIRIPGTRHRQAQQPCEDVVYQFISEDCLFWGLADGQSGTAYGAEGGRAALEAVSACIQSMGIGNFLNTPFPDELPCTLTHAYRKRLLQLAESRSCPLKEFSSTLLAIALDRKTGNYGLIHLGDGCAVGIPVTGDPILLSAPENGLSACQTWLTTSESAVSHLRIRYGSLETKKRILLFSDGAACFCKGRNIPWRAKTLLTQGTPSQLAAHLTQSNPADDATCILLEMAGKDPSAENLPF